MNNETLPSSMSDLLKGLSSHDFLKVGMNEIAYIRPIDSLADHTVFAVHAADGTQLSILDNMEMVIATLRNNALLPVTLH
jgi:hypothetical protein